MSLNVDITLLVCDTAVLYNIYQRFGENYWLYFSAEKPLKMEKYFFVGSA